MTKMPSGTKRHPTTGRWLSPTTLVRWYLAWLYLYDILTPVFQELGATNSLVQTQSVTRVMQLVVEGEAVEGEAVGEITSDKLLDAMNLT
jgi:hypothetical protein